MILADHVSECALCLRLIIRMIVHVCEDTNLEIGLLTTLPSDLHRKKSWQLAKQQMQVLLIPEMYVKHLFCLWLHRRTVTAQKAAELYWCAAPLKYRAQC